MVVYCLPEKSWREKCSETMLVESNTYLVELMRLFGVIEIFQSMVDSLIKFEV